MKDIADSEERSKNVIIVGNEDEDEDEDNVEARVYEVFDAIGEKPRPEEVSCTRKKRTDYHRPVIVKFRHIAGVLKKVT